MHEPLDPPDRPAFEAWADRVSGSRTFRAMLDDGVCPLCADATLTVEWCGSVLVLSCPCMPGLPVHSGSQTHAVLQRVQEASR